jgi:xanthine dehydrogenase YagS FAD-binding subunit
MLTALDATLTIAGSGGKRNVPISGFFTLPKNSDTTKENILKQSEIVTEIQVPASALAARSAYIKFKERESLDFAMAAAAAAVEIGADGKVKQARIVLGGVAPIPWAVPNAAQTLVGKSLDDAAIAAAADAALEGAQPLAKNAYKIPLTKTLVRRALAKIATV